MRYQFSVTGTMPLLMHANDIEARDVLDSERKSLKGGKPGDDRSPAHTWKSYLYISEETGKVCMPFENLLSMLLDGGKKIRIKGKETLKAYTQSILFDRQDFELMCNGAPIDKATVAAITGDFSEQADAVRQLGFRLQVKPCKVGDKSHVRVRPIFDNWAVSGEFEVDDADSQILTLATLTDLWRICGRQIGLGDWRPSSKKPGQYGRFLAMISRI